MRPGATLAHIGQHRLHHRHRTEHVHLELATQVVHAGFLHHAFVTVSGIVHENVDGADIFLDLGNGWRDP